MKHKKIVVISLIAVGVIAISSEVQAKIAAEKGFPDAIHEFKLDYKDYHFKKAQDVTKAYLGNPIGEYKLNVDDYNSSKPVDQQLTGPWVYLFPVMVNGEPRNEITVAFTQNHRWEFVGFGGNMSSIVKSVEKKYNITNVKLMNPTRCNFIIGNDKNNKIKIIGQTAGGGYRQYSNDDFNEMIQSYKKILQKQKEEYKKTGRIIIGSSMMQLTKLPTQEPAIYGLVKYFKSIF